MLEDQTFSKKITYFDIDLATIPTSPRLKQCKLLMAEEELNDLIKRCVKGNRRAQESLYQTFYGKMMGVSLRYTRNRDQAEDIVQDAFLKVFGSLERYDFKGSFEGWVRRIVVNTAIDMFRKKKNDFLLLGNDQSVEDYAEVEDQTENEDDSPQFKASQVIEAMTSLSPAYRTIFNLYVFEKMTHQQIADKLGISVGTSKSNYAKAKRNLKKILINEYMNK